MKKYLISICMILVVIYCVSQTSNEDYADGAKPSNEYYFGIPLPNLSSKQLDDFEKGRELFNYLFTINEINGADFNELSCISCHNTPIPGGSGTYSNTFVAVLYGTDSSEKIFRRYSAINSRVIEHDLPAAYFLRKTPALFGLGLLECADSALIKTFNDPEDKNKDGISGRILYDSLQRAGRFGWKVQFSSLEDFIRHAYKNEIGLTIDNKTLQISGYSLDEFIYLISQYLKYLSPPYDITNRQKTNDPGTLIFNQIGCQKCHLEQISTISDDPVLNNKSIRPFTDLLLHDLTQPVSLMTRAMAGASKYEYRTAPLWGLNSTGPPYMHDGSALTIESCIEMHNGEAIQSKLAYRSLSAINKALLIHFLKKL